MDIATIAKLIVGLLVLIAVVAMVVAFNGGYELMSDGFAKLTASTTPAPWDTPERAAKWSWGLFPIVPTLLQFVGWCIAAAGLSIAWRIVRLFL